MPDVHLLQWTVAFVGALWLTSQWLLYRPSSRWRHIILGLVSTLLWIPVAYTAENVAVADGGQTVTFGSGALATFAVFMVVVNVGGLLVGLLLWAEEEVEETSGELSDDVTR